MLYISTGCLAKKYIQLKMFIIEKVRNKFKHSFHGCKNISLSSLPLLLLLLLLLLIYFKLTKLQNFLQK